MALIGWGAVLLILAIVIVCKIGIAILETIATVASSMKEGWNKIWSKKEIGKKDKATQSESSFSNRMATVTLSPIKYSDSTERFGISGKCKICGKAFSSVSSASENYLTHVDFEFYGKKRNKSVCKKCVQLLAGDSNCKIIKIYEQ